MSISSHTASSKHADQSFRSLNDPLTTSIRLLNTVAIKLKEGRIRAGALSLSSAELKIHLDSSESAEPIDVEQKQQRETNSLVEEFMLLANISVAAKIQETFPATAVLRSVEAAYYSEVRLAHFGADGTRLRPRPTSKHCRIYS